MCLGFNIMEQLEKNSDSRVGIFTTTLYDSALSWFAIEPMWYEFLLFFFEDIILGVIRNILS